MRPIKEYEIGLMFWTTGDPEKDLARLSGFGLAAGQLGFPGDLPLQDAGHNWKSALPQHPELALTTAVCSYIGEDYADVETVRNSVGLVPQNTRAERIERTKAVADVAASLEIRSVACHIGFVPEDRHGREYKEVCALVSDICDHLAKNQQDFTLETGQEPAEALLAFIEDVGKSNLKINFDPANMVLYGMGDPVGALQALGRHVISIHCKDGASPQQPGALGIEKPLGSGEVDYPVFLKTLRTIGYKGLLSIEREEPDTKRREEDIAHAVQYLGKLLKS